MFEIIMLLGFFMAGVSHFTWEKCRETESSSNRKKSNSVKKKRERKADRKRHPDSSGESPSTKSSFQAKRPICGPSGLKTLNCCATTVYKGPQLLH